MGTFGDGLKLPTPYYHDEKHGIIVHNADCRKAMADMAECSIDAVVTDPPYELAFMGKKWDSTGIAYSVNVWRECLRVLKPGGHLLAFGGTRTYHRMVCAIEDAGFEVRDAMTWLYGSGFPKSADTAKEFDKRAFSTWLTEHRPRARRFRHRLWTAAKKDRWAWRWCELATLRYGEIVGKREVVGTEKKTGCLPDRPNFGANDRSNGQGMGFRAGDIPITLPATPEAQQWQGWGTSLKPACELICVSRKPFRGTVAANVLRWGTGGINVDGGRIGTDDNLNGGAYAKDGQKRDQMWGEVARNSWRRDKGLEYVQPKGRFPANLLLTHHPECDEDCRPDCPVRMLDEQSGASRSVARVGQRPGKAEGCLGAFRGQEGVSMGHTDSGGASRFFYTGKAPSRERYFLCKTCDAVYPHKEYKAHEEHDTVSHPTQKPVDLMRYLVRLVTPPGGIVLDPFAGTFTTLVAAQAEGLGAVGIEMLEDYCRIGQVRVGKRFMDRRHRLIRMRAPLGEKKSRLAFF